MVQNISIDQEVISQFMQKSPEEIQNSSNQLLPNHISQLIEYFYENDTNKGQKKINALLVGLSYDKFEKFLINSSPVVLSILQKEAFGEPLQHLLALSHHQQKRAYAEVLDQLQAIEREVKTFAQENFSQLLYDQTIQAIKFVKSRAEDFFVLSKRVLQLSWNTNRLDLITKLGYEKEAWEKILISLIGHPRTVVSESKGIYKLLESQLYFIYQNDDDSSIDGLFNLNCWSIQDYWRLGLLPEISEEPRLDQLTLDEQKEYFTKVQRNLDLIGLHTVRDLKFAHIYTQEALSKFISEHLS